MIKKAPMKRKTEVVLVNKAKDEWVFPMREAYDRARRTVDAPPGPVQLYADVPTVGGGGSRCAFRQ